MLDSYVTFTGSCELYGHLAEFYVKNIQGLAKSGAVLSDILL